MIKKKHGLSWSDADFVLIQQCEPGMLTASLWPLVSASGGGKKSASLWCCSWWYHRLVAMVMMTPSDLPGDSEAHHREFCRPPTHQQLCGFSWRFWRHFCLFPIKKEPWIKVDSKSPLRFSSQVSCWEIKSLCYFTCLSRYNCYLNRLYCFLSSLLIVKSCGQRALDSHCWWMRTVS